MQRHTILALVGLIAVCAQPLGAQADPDSVKLRNDCRLAGQVLQTGHPAPRLQWASTFIRACGPDAVAEANVAALNRLRAAADSPELKQVWNQLQYVRDARIYRTVVDIARDRRASVNTRVDALLWLQRLRAPQQFATKAEVTGGFDANGRVQGGCGRFTRLAGTVSFYDGEALPSGYVAEITELGRRVSADMSEPLDVRTAARCAQTLGWGRG